MPNIPKGPTIHPRLSMCRGLTCRLSVIECFETDVGVNVRFDQLIQF